MSDKRRKARSWPVWLALLVAAGVAVAGSWVAYDKYGGSALWPGLVGNFVASLAAFMLALSWERSRERSQLDRDAVAARDEQDKRAAELQELRMTEVRRRLEPVRAELDRNRESLEMLAGAYAEGLPAGSVRVLHPQLLDTAWTANAARLTELVANYQLTSDLSTAYGRIEELRWRLRQRTATLSVMAGSEIARVLAQTLEDITKPLVGELLTEVKGLIDRVDGQRADPEVQPLGLVHVDAATVGIRITGSATGEVSST